MEPGTLQVETWNYSDPPSKRLVVTDGMHVVCEVASDNGQHNPYTIPWEQAERNAEIIAASPDLLKALMVAVDYLETHRPTGDIKKIFEELNHYENAVMKPARAAIAKAKGGTV